MRRSHAAAIALALVISTPAAADPRIFFVGNAASFSRFGMANWGIAPGSLFTVTGDGLGPPEAVKADGFPLRTELGGARVQVRTARGSADAYVLLASSSRSVALLPSSAPPGNAQILVSFSGVVSPPEPSFILDRNFGIFTQNDAGSGPAVAHNLNGPDDQPLNTLLESARPGQMVALSGTGLGPVSGDESVAALPGDLKTGIQLFVGRVKANVVSAGRSDCCAGMDQIIFEVPQGVEGCYVPVSTNIPDLLAQTMYGQTDLPSNFATISVAAAGGACTDPTGIPAGDLLKLQQNGSLSIGAISVGHGYSASDNKPSPQGADAASAAFSQYDVAGLLRAKGIFGMPAKGACLAYTVDRNADHYTDPVTPQALDAGPALNLTSDHGTAQLAGARGLYAGPLGTNFLAPGDYSIDNGAGGSDVGAFQATFRIPEPVTWTNKSRTNPARRTDPVQVTWTGGNQNDYVVLVSFGHNNTVGFYQVCTEDIAAGSFATPLTVNLSIPLERNVPGSFGTVPGLIIFGTAAKTVRFSAPGLDDGFISASLLDAIYSP